MQRNHEYFMGLALKDAHKSNKAVGRGVGAVVVHEGAVVGRSGKRRASLTDPTAHAEVTAIRKAARKLGRLDLSGCTLYTTLEPCPMCCGSIIVSKVSTLVVGARHKPEQSEWGEYGVEKVLSMAGWDKGHDLIMNVRAEEGDAVWQASQAKRATSRP